MKELFSKYKSLVLVLFLSLVAGFSLLRPGLPPTHDGEYHVIRFYEFDKAIRDGDLYPRWAKDLNNGYGVPLFNYVYPLPNYAAFFLHLAGISFIDSFKLIMFLSTIIGAVFFYLWTKEYWGSLGGVVSSIFYTFSPYHFVDIYIRGSVGEVMALAIFPALLWAFKKMIDKGSRKFFVTSSVLLALLILSHNILALMFFAFFIAYAAISIYPLKKSNEMFRKMFLMVLLGLGLSSPFWMPAVAEKGYSTGLQVFDINTNFPEVYELLIPSWGSGIFGEIKNQMSTQIGIANLLAILIVGAFIIFPTRKKIKNLSIIIFFLISFFVVFFMMLPISAVFWNNIPFLNYFQFPWRLLSLEIIIASFLAGAVITPFNKKAKIVIAFLAMLFVVTTTIGYTKPAFYHLRDDKHYISRSNFIDGTNSPGNVFNTKWLKEIPAKKENKLEFKKGHGDVVLHKDETSNYEFVVASTTGGTLTFNNAYFPGWTSYVNGERMIATEDSGLISAPIGRGKSKIEFKFENTPVRNLSWIYFFASSISLIMIGFPAIIKKNTPK